MRKHEANKLSMFDAVISCMETNSNKYSGIPAIGEILTRFKNLVSEIKSMDFEFFGSTKSETSDKRIKEEALLRSVVKIANALYAYGIKTKNTELIVKNKISKSSLDDLREQVMINKSREILAMANEHLEALADYGIINETLTSAGTDIDAFQDAIAKQSNTRVESIAEREALKNKFQEATAVLNDELDPTMELFEESDPVFYDEYKSARVIRDMGLRHKEEESTGEGQQV